MTVNLLAETLAATSKARERHERLTEPGGSLGSLDSAGDSGARD
jgi:hypothetical protein